MMTEATISDDMVKYGLGCPFCGSPDSLEVREYRFRGFSEYRVVCTPSLCGCGGEGPVASEWPQAVDHWNQRAAKQPNAALTGAEGVPCRGLVGRGGPA